MVNECLNFVELLDNSLLYSDNKLFQFTGREEITFRDNYNRVMALANYMLGIPEDNLVIMVNNPVNYAMSYLAAVISGHVACLGNPSSEDTTAFFQLSNRRIFTDDDFVDGAKLRPVDRKLLPKRSSYQLSTVALSSGTASKTRRLVGLSQANILYDTKAAMEYDLYSSKSKCVHILPYWHLFGIATELIAPLYSGATVCIPESKLGFFSSLRVFEPTFLQMTPAIANELAKQISKRNKDEVVGSNLYKVVVSGAGLDSKTFRQMMDFGIKVCTAYGLTECSPCVSMMPEWDIRSGTSGKIIPGMTVKISSEGEILVKGPATMLGYLSNDSSIQDYTEDGWLHTGDMGTLDEDHYLSITGRKSSVIVLNSGKKYVPEEIERDINEQNNVLECRLETYCNGDDQFLLIRIVYKDNKPDIISIRNIMKRYSSDVYKIVLQEDKLARNEMGKLIR